MPDFVPLCLPTLRKRPPTGPDWLHEIKFDGWRVEVMRSRDDVRLYSRNRTDLTRRFPTIVEACRRLPPCVVDAELVAMGADGRPDFLAITRKRAHLVLWGFDLLWARGRDIRGLALEERRRRLEAIVAKVDSPLLRFSEAFDDGEGLLESAEAMGLEGIVSKRRSERYRSGRSDGWIKVKRKGWDEIQRQRTEHFNR